MKSSSSDLSLKANINLFGKSNRIPIGDKFKKNNNYNKYNIIYNSPYKSINDILSSSNNSNVYKNLYSLNNSIINNDNKISLSQSNVQIKFFKFLEKENNNKQKIMY